MGHQSELATPHNSDDESGDAFTDGDFGDSDDEHIIERNDNIKASHIPINETKNEDIHKMNGATNGFSKNADFEEQPRHIVRSVSEAHSSDVENPNIHLSDLRRDSHGDQSPSIVGILGDQQNHAEQRLAARRAARAEAREIRMRELERQQREQEDHADKAYDMYAGKTETVGRRDRTRLAALSPASSVLSPRRSSEDSVDDLFSMKDLRHELKEVEEKFRKAMILNAQLDNDKAALGYQLELLKDRIEELHEEYAQLQREHREKCSSLERVKREFESVSRELSAARDAVRARDCAAAAAGFAFVEAAALDAAPSSAGQAVGAVPPLALVSHHAEQLLNDAGEGTLDVRLQNLLSSKQSLESEVRKLKLQLNEERAARQNGVANHHDQEYENELEAARKGLSEAKGRAARAEAEAALNAAHVARLEAQLARLRARQDHQDEHEEQLKQERRKLQREVRTHTHTV
ncbi:unnamed protein product, partial [Arctia plantaginis]